MAINVDRYYRGVAGENIRQLADCLLRLSQEAQHQAAYDAAFRLADAATQLLDVGSEVDVKRPLLANRKRPSGGQVGESTPDLTTGSQASWAVPR